MVAAGAPGTRGAPPVDVGAHTCGPLVPAESPCRRQHAPTPLAKARVRGVAAIHCQPPFPWHDVYHHPHPHASPPAHPAARCRSTSAAAPSARTGARKTCATRSPRRAAPRLTRSCGTGCGGARRAPGARGAPCLRARGRAAPGAGRKTRSDRSHRQMHARAALVVAAARRQRSTHCRAPHPCPHPTPPLPPPGAAQPGRLWPPVHRRVVCRQHARPRHGPQPPERRAGADRHQEPHRCGRARGRRVRGQGLERSTGREQGRWWLRLGLSPQLGTVQ